MLLDLLRDFWEFIKKKILVLVRSRLIPLGLAFVLMFSVLTVHLFDLQILRGASAQEQYTATTRKVVSIPSTRGNIYDRNGVLLAYNRMVYVVEVTDTGAYKNGYEKNKMLIRLISILNDHNEALTTIIPIICENGRFEFTVEDNARLRFLRDMYGLKTINDFTEAKPADITAEEAFLYMKDHYGVGKNSSREGDTYEISDEDALAVLNLRFSLSTNSYQKFVSIEAASDVSSETMQDILEHSNEMLGVDVVEDYIREYPNAECFAPVIGYTAVASREDLDSLNAEGGNYVIGDRVGKTGIESTFESALCGEKGERVIYVDSVGHITEVESETAPTAGGDVWLSIDSDLQVGIYHILEQQLAGIILQKLVEGNYDIDPDMSSYQRKISINNLYYNLLDNAILDMDHFGAEDASEAEKRIYSAYAGERDQALTQLESELTSGTPANYQDLPDNIQEYMTYTFGALKDAGVLVNSRVDINDPVYQQYRTDETMSFQEFLRYALKMSWIDTTKLELDSKYTNAEDTYQALVKMAMNLLNENRSFMKKLYDELLHSDGIAACDMCLALFDQEVLVRDPVAIAALESGNASTAYQFIRDKITTLELTPAMLALDPCTAAATIVDTSTGHCLAMVSYPGYDNGRVTDSAYFYRLNQDKSSPLYSAATQTRTAPGSTYKLCSTIAGLTEKVINEDTVFDCQKIFTERGLELRCTGRHGPLRVRGGILHSCNVFFCSVGYALSMNTMQEYSGVIGIENVQKYANMVGLGTKSGVEVMEKEPHVSDVNPIPSAIGQGSHSYTNVQLARYATTLATSGTVYNLSLVDKVVDMDGKTVLDHQPEIVSTCEEVSDETWQVVHDGMYLVVHSGSHKKEFDDRLMLAGKTGTAEENKLRPNHATFIGYAPYDAPKWSFAVTIPFGYSSTYSSRMTNEVMKYVEGMTTLEKVLNTTVTAGSGTITAD